LKIGFLGWDAGRGGVTEDGIAFVLYRGLVVDINLDGADIDCFREGEEGEDESKGDEGNCYVVDYSPWVVDGDQAGGVGWLEEGVMM